MKRFLGKTSKQPKDTQSTAEDRYYQTPIHAQYATHARAHSANLTSLYPNSNLRDNVHPSPTDDQPWEVVVPNDDSPQPRVLAPSRSATLPPGTSPPSPPILRSSSPYSFVSNPPNKPSSIKDRDIGQLLKKKSNQSAPVALSILKSLDATRQNEPNNFQSSLTNLDQSSDGGHLDNRDREVSDKKERRGFWGNNKERPPWKDRSKEKDQRDDAVLTRMIGYLTVTASEDWMLVLEICDKASSSEANAKEAVRALRREFKYGEPAAQLSAARLWAIMSRNCSEAFVTETAGRKFVATLEDLMTSPRTSPVVRERLLGVIAAAAYNSPKDSTFRSLWKRVKPSDKPEEGVPFDVDDEMINPPISIRQAQHDSTGFSLYPSIPMEPNAPGRKRLSPTRDRIIPLEEDIRRLFQECHIGLGNAALLSDALGACKPEKMKKDPVIREFLMKCRTSQELIYAQIPWATAGAERSRVAPPQTAQRPRPVDDSDANGDEQTIEERLLGELLKANEDLLFVLKQYDDLERVALERKIVRTDPRNIDSWHPPDYPQSFDGTASSRSPSPSIRSDTPPRPSHAYDSRSQTSLDIQSQLLAPPPAPHGPRSPQPIVNSRTPPSTLVHDRGYPVDSHAIRGVDQVQNTISVQLDDDDIQAPLPAVSDMHDADTRNMDYTPPRPSIKALGKRRLVESISNKLDLNMHKPNVDSVSLNDSRNDSESDEDDNYAWLHPPVNYVYDAAAERTQQRIQEATAALVVNGVH